MNSEVIKMEVNIAGERISLSVPFSRQEAVRNTEAELAALYRAWGEKFPRKTPKQLLAMMAYKFASSYYDLIQVQNDEAESAGELLEFARNLCDGGDPIGNQAEEFPLY